MSSEVIKWKNMALFCSFVVEDVRCIPRLSKWQPLLKKEENKMLERFNPKIASMESHTPIIANQLDSQYSIAFRAVKFQTTQQLSKTNKPTIVIQNNTRNHQNHQ